MPEEKITPPGTRETPPAISLPFASHIKNLREKLSGVPGKQEDGRRSPFMTTYLASLAISDATRPEIFSYAANRPEYISSKYIAKVDMFVKKWNYSYSESMMIVAGGRRTISSGAC